MLFHSSLRKDLARSFGATLIVMLTIVMTMMLIRTLGRAAGGRCRPQDVVMVMGYTVLGYLPTMLSLSLFIAIAATLSRMYRDSEMVIWFASGVGLRRFVRPLLRSAAPVLLVVALSVGFVWPWVNSKGVELTQTYEQPLRPRARRAGPVPESRDGRRVFFLDKESDDDAHRAATSSSSPSRATASRSPRPGAAASRCRPTAASWCSNAASATRRTGAPARRPISRFDTYHVLAGDRALPTEPEAQPKALKTIDLLREPTPRQPGRAGLAARHGARRASTWCCSPSAWPPPTRAAPATGTCCSRCSPSSSTSTCSTCRRPGWRAARPACSGCCWSSTAACWCWRWRCCGGATMRRAAGRWLHDAAASTTRQQQAGA